MLVEDYLKTGELISILDKLASDDTPIYLIWFKSPYLQPKLRVIIEELAELAKTPKSRFKAE